MVIDNVSYSFETWISALVGAGLVGCIGLLPILIVPNEDTKIIFFLIKKRVLNKVILFLIK